MPKIASQLSQSVQTKAQTCFFNKVEYETQLLKAQLGFLSLQQEIFRKKRKMVIVLEGSDTAGKGGLVRRVAQHSDPRTLHVFGIGKPTVDESAQHYFQRFFARLPQSGEICIFDRSWYGRVLVERVEGFAQRSEWERAYGEINNIEKMLMDDGILILKYLLDISYSEQTLRFEARKKDPLKSWKLTDEDYRNRKKWDAYQMSFKEMTKRTSTKICPWTVVPANSKWFARVHILNDIVRRANRFYK